MDSITATSIATEQGVEVGQIWTRDGKQTRITRIIPSVTRAGRVMVIHTVPTQRSENLFGEIETFDGDTDTVLEVFTGLYTKEA
ncbi:hypothetical protein [Microbacterium rhizophilus]|uniref:hypothetical protein n=1 Tax=Microbacterium rhizophilus TaxID=3138934 RepID=UPI0031E81C9D